MSDDEAAIGFSAFPGIGPVRYALLVKAFGKPSRAWSASESELENTGLGNAIRQSFIHFRNTFQLQIYIHALQQLGVTALSIHDPRYPQPLRQISDAPIVLYVRGKRKGNLIDFSKAVSVVGTRTPTTYGKEMTRRITTCLVANGCPVISGMALGIDAIAHQTAIDCGGQSIAVLGCGVDVIAPMSNSSIYQKLISGGCGAVVSEMPLSHKPSKGIFPARNRIISGLSRCTVIVEGTKYSGSLITARYAADQGRDVCAVPGPVTSPFSEGPNELIRSGALVVTTGKEILDMLDIVPIEKTQSTNTSTGGISEKILSLFKVYGPLGIDAIAEKMRVSPEELLGELSLLEISGIVRDYGGKVYGKNEN